MDLGILATLFGMALAAPVLDVERMDQRVSDAIIRLSRYHTEISDMEQKQLKEEIRNACFAHFVNSSIQQSFVDRVIQEKTVHFFLHGPCVLNTLELEENHKRESIFPLRTPWQRDNHSCGHWIVPLALVVLNAFEGKSIHSTFIATQTVNMLKNEGAAFCIRQHTLPNQLFPSLADEDACIQAGIRSLESQLHSFYGNNCVPGQCLEPEHIFHLSQRLSWQNLSLRNFHLLSFAAGRSQGIFFDQGEPLKPDNFKHCDKERLRERYTSLIQRDFKENDETIHFFVCHLQDPLHWVLIVLIKLHARSPIMLIFDTINKTVVEKNTPILANSPAYLVDYITFLEERFMMEQQNSRRRVEQAEVA